MKKRDPIYKLPKEIQILNYNFEVKRDANNYGYFALKDENNHNKPTIVVTGDPTYAKHEIVEIFIHEVLEITLELLRCRYERPDADQNYEFHYSHKEHDICAKVLTRALEKMIK